ncbi:MAG: Rrf2 family transcriptional regulator [Clostridiales Family XIII bacterium]|jgi:DNA-binding IscR family transcriptional regulator|nr:Rrf2 family transcriptional regulator [Clostridiales Family XIII bacterium]
MGYSTSFTQGITLLLTLHAMQTNTGDAITPTKLLAKYAGIPFASAVKTLKSLSSAGITITKEGVGGGSMLAKPIPQITLLDVFLAVEQDAPLFKMHMGINCDQTKVGDLKRRVEVSIGNAADAMKDSLRGVTLENIWEGSL